jgi:hypothetical protein
MPDDRPVLSSELQAMTNELKEYFSQEMNKLARDVQDTNHTIEGVNKRLSTLTGRVEQLEVNKPKEEDEDEDEDDIIYGSDGEPDMVKTNTERLRRRRLKKNTKGMGGNKNRRSHGNDDPYAKVKFTIPSFHGRYDAEEHLDWEMTVEQKFTSHLVPDQHKVRQATNEFKDFAIIWWQECAQLNIQPDSWDDLKIAMRDRFVPASYKRDMRKKLQRLDQGDMSVQEYYAELQKGMLRCGVVEDAEDKVCRFYGGLNRDIQDIVDYKTFNTTNQLFQLAMLAEKELQGRRKDASTTRTFVPPAARPPSFSPSPPSPAVVSEVSKVSTVQAKMPSTPTTSSSSKSAGIVCHKCKGMGHVMRECPSSRTFIAARDGNGYISTSDVEDDPEDAEGETINSAAASADLPILMVQRVLSSHEEPEVEERIQRKNLFHMYLIVENCRVLTIIDSGSCNNLVSSDLVEKLKLPTRFISDPYYLQWLNSSGQAKVTKSARIHFSVGSYHDYADFDVVPMQASSLLLGRPWEFDHDASHHGRTNTYTFMHKDKKIKLLPLTPAEIKKHFDDKLHAKNVEKESAPSNASSRDPHNGIKLKGGTFLATISAAAELCDNPDAPCYTMLCQDVCYVSNDPMSCTLHPVGTNLLQELAADEMESRTTPIQAGGNDEDIATLQLYMSWTFPSCVSSPTLLPRPPRFQHTHSDGFGDISHIRRRNEAYKNALERGQ